MIKKSICLFMILCMAFLTVACAKQPMAPPNPMTAEELGDLQNALIEEEKRKEEEKEAEKENEDKKDEDEVKEPVVLPDDATVYWLKSGSVYHGKQTCSYLTNKLNIETGTKSDAIKAGKERLCSRCAKESG